MVYYKSKELDYPSIGQLRAAFERNKIKPIFAVTEEVQPLYEVLCKTIYSNLILSVRQSVIAELKLCKSMYKEYFFKTRTTRCPEETKNHCVLDTYCRAGLLNIILKFSYLNLFIFLTFGTTA